jgi:hypothetical protein
LISVAKADVAAGVVGVAEIEGDNFCLDEGLATGAGEVGQRGQELATGEEAECPEGDDGSAEDWPAIGRIGGGVTHD